MRLRTRLILLIGIAAGPALALLIQSQFDSRESEIANTHRKAQEIAHSAALYNETSIQSLRHVLVGLRALLPQVRTDPQLCLEVTSRLDTDIGHGAAFGAFDERGRLLCGDQRMSPRVLAFRQRPDMARPLAVATLAAGGPASALPSLSFVEPVEQDGEIAGFVTASVSPDWLAEQLGRFPLSTNAAVMLLDRNGYVLARRPGADGWLGERVSAAAQNGPRPQPSGAPAQTIAHDPRPRIVAAASVPSFPNDLFIQIGLDRDAALEGINRVTARNAVVLALIALAIVATAIATWETAGALARHEGRLLEEKAAAERLAAGQQRIADTIGHDLRNSVQTLVSFLRNLRRSGGRPPDPAMLPHVARAVGDLRSSLDVLIRASRLESGSLEPQGRTVQLSAFLKKIANDWQFYAETKGLTMTVSASRETVKTDPDLLRTIVSNLVSNAIKHTDEGGVTVSVETDAEGRLVICVRDTGKGIPPGKADIIFDAFSRLEPEKTDGLGLGLSIAKRSAALLGCEIVLDRTVERGSRFTVRLPEAAAAHKQSDRKG